jgi:capsular polysaccharide biosynthesis protein
LGKEDQEARPPVQLAETEQGDRFSYVNEESISLKELVVLLYNGRKIIAAITLAAVLFAAAASIVADRVIIGMRGEVQTVIKLYFSGIKQGKTPDGRDYDINEIKSASILQEAIDMSGLSKIPSVTRLSEHISFEAILTNSVALAIQNAETETLKLEERAKLIQPDSYVAILDVGNPYNPGNYLGITKNEGMILLNNIMSVYREKMTEDYSGHTQLASVFSEEESLDSYDYIRIADMADKQIRDMQAYVTLHLKDSAFRASSTGLSRVDIESALTSMRTVDIEMLYARIASNYITKNAGQSAAVYEEIAKEEGQIWLQNNERAFSLLTLLKNYQKQIQAAVIGSATETETPSVETVPLEIKDPQYDRMVTQYIDASTKSSTAAANADYYRNEAERFRSAETLSGPGSKAAQDADVLCDKIKKNLIVLTKNINDTVSDYYRAINRQKYVEQLIPAMDYFESSSVNLFMNIAIAVAAGIVISLLIIFFRAYILPEILKTDETAEGPDGDGDGGDPSSPENVGQTKMAKEAKL